MNILRYNIRTWLHHCLPWAALFCCIVNTLSCKFFLEFTEWSLPAAVNNWVQSFRSTAQKSSVWDLTGVYKGIILSVANLVLEGGQTPQRRPETCPGACSLGWHLMVGYRIRRKTSICAKRSSRAWAPLQLQGPWSNNSCYSWQGDRNNFSERTREAAKKQRQGLKNTVNSVRRKRRMKKQ